MPKMNPKIPPPAAAFKLRLMCSHGGYIVPRPHDKSLFYAGGETRIVALDRRTTVASLPVLAVHLSRTIFNNRPFHLKYQLPNEGLDSLISVVTDEDLLNMLEEHDRITPPSRIRLFLFPSKPESLGSTLLDPKSDTWFCDALKSTRILPKGQSADSGLLMGIGSEIETPAECSGSSVEDRYGAESLALETSLSLKSTGSSNSMENSLQIGIVQCENNGSNLLQRKIRVPSSASIESDNSVGSAAPPSKTGFSQESIVQTPTEAPSFLIESESTFWDHSCNLPTSKPVKVLGYPISQQPDGKQLQHESQYIQGNLHYIPQHVTNPMSMSPYYPVYQMPSHQQHVPCPTNLSYPIYLVPVRSAQYLHTSMQCNFIDANTPSSSNRPLHLQTAAVALPVTHKEISGAQPVTELATKSYKNDLDDTLLVSVPSSSDQLVMVPNESQISSEPVATTSVPSLPGIDFDEDIAYNPIYKTQPTPPVLPSQYQTLKMGTTLLLSESSVHRQI